MTEAQEAPAHRRYFLKSKIKALSAESAIIKSDEAKLIRLARKRAAKGKSRTNLDKNHAGLHNHRHRVRVEARHSQLAYGFLRGRGYTEMEQAVFTIPVWDKVENIVKRFTDDDWRTVGQRWAEWKDAAAAAALESRTATTRKAVNRRAMSRATYLWYSTPEGQESREARAAKWHESHQWDKWD
jgi:hypothetical protein